MRGIVTLAAAYALPAGFPYRELILLCAFCVVVGTLIVQGMLLRPLIRWLNLNDDGSVEAEIQLASEALARVAHQVLDGDGSAASTALRAEFTLREEAAEDGSASEHEVRNQLRAKIVNAQRHHLVRLRDNAEIGDDAFRALEERLDWAEINFR